MIKIINLIIVDDDTFNDFVDYMYNEMTGNEYGYLSEISDEISQENLYYKFIDAYKFLANKYPKEIKKIRYIRFYRSSRGFCCESSRGAKGKI